MLRRIIKQLGFNRSSENADATPKSAGASKKRTPDKPEPSSAGKPRRHRKPSSGKRGPEKERAPRWSLDDFNVPPKDGEVRFHDFDIPEPLMQAIQDLGFKYCTPIQHKVFSHAKDGLNIAGRAQTGTGKTAAFLLCVFSHFLHNRIQQKSRKPGVPRALVLAPTRELVIQIVKDAHALGKHTRINSVAVYGGMDFKKQQNQLARRPVDLIAATPGRLLDFMRRNVIDLSQLEVLVIDEADRMLDMGFIPDIRRIVRATPPKTKRSTMLFSATLTDDVLRLSAQWITDPVFCEIEPENVTVDTVEQIVYIVTMKEKFKLLCYLLDQQDMKRVLIFGNRRIDTQRLADRLRKRGITCAYLSGAVSQEKRVHILEDFRSGKVRVLVATDVVGRGLHIDNITHVINYEFPYDAEDYVHRIGRTGRAGIAGRAISFACESESFAIPDIEAYIGRDLKCIMPDPEWLH